MSDAPLPRRPRLVSHALVRRHVVDGSERVVIHDPQSGGLSSLEPRAWDIARGADGTRDLDGICLAAARAGAFHRRSEVRFVLEALHGGGLLADGVAEPATPPPRAGARPLALLPGYALDCDGSGGCCGVYGTIRFSRDEAARARAVLPAPLGSDIDQRLFMPETGCGADEPAGALAVTMVDGACAFLGEGGACRLHAAAGAASKPAGCRSFPATFVDDGQEVRVSVTCECACVLASAAAPGGEALVPADARVAGDLPQLAPPGVLPEAIALGAAGSAPRRAFVDWGDAVRAAVTARPPDDVPSFLWALADAVDARGLALDGVEAALTCRAPWTPEALAAWTSALRARAASKVLASAAWRSRTDRVRRMADWIDAAARTLDEGTAGGGDAASDEQPVAGRGADASAAAYARKLTLALALAGDERFYLQALLFGHHLAGPLPVADALRDRALRCLLARQVRVPDTESERARRHPLAAVEALMRGQGLDAYVTPVAR